MAGKVLARHFIVLIFMEFLPDFPVPVTQFALFGLLLLAGLIGGETAAIVRLPRLIGYLIMGVLSGPAYLNILNPALLSEARLFIDISLGLILFELGRHLNLIWLRNNPWLLIMAFCESGLTFLLCLALLLSAGFTYLPAAVAATIAMASSPAVVLLVVQDVNAEGPVTRHTITLIALNNLVALLLFNLFLPHLQDAKTLTTGLRWAEALYRIAGSTTLGLVLFLCATLIARLTAKRETNQFVLLVGLVIVAISFSKALNLSVLLTLLIFGLGARNLDRKRVLMELDFGLMGRLFFIPLFVVTGAFLKISSNWSALLLVMALLLARSLGKAAGILFCANKTCLTKQQGSLIALALTPMAGLAISLTQRISDFNPTLGAELAAIMATLVAILHVLGPLATQFALLRSGEAHSADAHDRTNR